MTSVVAVSSMKGGTGKTTVSYNMAERAHAAGLRVILVDCDPMEGALGLAYLREEAAWAVVPGSMDTVGGSQIRGFRESGDYDLIVCDLPGRKGFSMGAVVGSADVTLSPVGVSPQELQSAREFYVQSDRMGWPVVFVPNLIPSTRRREMELVSEISGWGSEVCPVMLHHRVAFMDSLRYGLGVCEFAPRSSAALEVQALWDWVQALLLRRSPVRQRPQAAREVVHAA